MSVKKEPSGRRSVEVEFEVPGTPEEVWQAIATGPGISAWLMPAEFEQRDGKPVALRLDFGAGMQSRAVVTAWDPPRTYAAQTEGVAPGAPPIASEWHVEAQAGGTCRLRLVHSLFASTDDWDDQLEFVGSGWSAFLVTLQLYLRHFRGLRSTLIKWMVPVAGPESRAWDALIVALGLQGVRPGERWAAPASAPALAGVAEYFSASPNDALLRLDTPGPGIAALGTVDMGGTCKVGMNIYLYGDAAADTAARVQPLWQAWFEQRFPAPSEARPGD